MSQYAGQRKVSSDIQKKIKRDKASAKSNEKKSKLKSIFYYAKLINKNRMKKSTIITVIVNEEPQKVTIGDYVKAKTKDLREFGYETLTEQEVLKSVERVLNKKTETVIDQFIVDDIVL